MISWFGGSELEKKVKFKRDQRAQRIAELHEYKGPLTKDENGIIGQSVSETVQQIKNNELSPRAVLKAFGKKALEVQSKCNALTEIMIRDAETWADESDKSGPLAGFPVSIKDSFIVKGYDSLAGYARFANQPHAEDGALAKVIRATGAYPFVRTNVPATMMAIEGYNDVWGRTTNPHNPDYAPGGSSQGEGALIASGGSRIGVGTDIGGSVRVPAAWSGLYSLKFSTYRFPYDGDVACNSGFEGVQYVASPMAKSLGDLRYFIEAIFSVNPWKYDYHLIPLPWRKNVTLPKKPRVGVLRLDDLLPLTPAQNRALRTVTDALSSAGCELVEFQPPEPSRKYDENVFKLYQADGYEGSVKPLLRGEHNDPYVEHVSTYGKLPWLFRKAWQFVLRLFGFKDAAERYRRAEKLSSTAYYKAVADREDLRRGFRSKWDEMGLDFMISAPHPSPAVPNYCPESFRAILYTSLFNMLDYPAGIIPVGHVDSTLDKLPPAFDISKLPYEGQISFDTYDAEKMSGLPTAVQVVGMRYQDEETLAAMEFVYDALKKSGVTYN